MQQLQLQLQLQLPLLLRKRWLLVLLPLLMCSLLLICSLLVSASHFSSFSPLYHHLLPFSFTPSSSSFSSSPSSPPKHNHLFVESKLRVSPVSLHPLPRLAYLISGSVGDGDTLKRTLLALYHPHNTYVLHLDLESSPSERLDIAAFVRDHPVFLKFANVRVVVRANLVTYRGPTMVANTLHASAILLKEAGDWDWFVNLSASDYPLVTQDDLLYTLAMYPRHLNFIEHTSDIGWKEWQRARPLMIDPGLYRLQKADIFWVTEKRSLPTAFKVFTGSAWMMLSHQFMEYCVWGWDNLPRTVLMYYANFLSSPEGYFHTVICNSDEFRNTTVNHDLHFISWDNPPKQHPHFLNVVDFPRIVSSNAPFARKFYRDDPVLDMIDKQILHREPGAFVAGGWFEGNVSNLRYKPVKDINDLMPGPGAEKLKLLINGLLSEKGFDQKHCI